MARIRLGMRHIALFSTLRPDPAIPTHGRQRLWPGRQRLVVGSILALGLVSASCGLGWSCLRAEEATEALQRFEFTEPQMGVPFRMVLYAPNAQKAEAASKAAFQRVAELNQIMSDYETDSELNELSRTSGKGRAVHVSDDLWAVITRAQTLAERTDGAFDITVGPVVSLWRRARRNLRLPEPERLAEARKAVGFRYVRLNTNDHTVELTRPGMKLDLGGIAKGYALDKALAILVADGVTRGLVSGGGDMALGDPPPGKTGWSIEIAPLDVPNAPPKRFVSLTNCALATSGDVFQRLEVEGRRYSHIVDPHTGIGLTDHGLVTVIAADCTTADGLATAVSTLGPAKGLELVEQTPGVEVLIVRKPAERIEMIESSGFKRFYSDTPRAE